MNRSTKRRQSLRRYVRVLLLGGCMSMRVGCHAPTQARRISSPESIINVESACVSAFLSCLQLAAGGSAQPSPPPEEREQQQRRGQGKLPKLPAVIQLISENFFSHRKRKQQDEDDIMVCHCPPPWRGGDGCGPACINRMLCIECTEVSTLQVAACHRAELRLG